MSKKKTNTAQDMIKYTSRDIGQEYIMKRRMVTAIVVAIIFAIALVVFIALYIDTSNKVQETYKRQYSLSIENVIYDIDSYNGAEGDKEFRYRRVVADMNSVASFAFLINDLETNDRRNTMNEFYTIFLKYPEQMQTKMDEAKQALTDINANLDKGYEEAQALIDSIDLKGY